MRKYLSEDRTMNRHEQQNPQIATQYPEYDEGEHSQLMEVVETDKFGRSTVPRRETSSVDHQQT